MSSKVEVHKHPRHVMQKKKWPEYFLEFSMIFLAVFLSFFAENYRERRVEMKHAREYAAAMVEDLAKDTAMLETQSRSYRTYSRVADSLLKFYDEGFNADNTAKFNFYVRFTMSSIPLQWSRVAIEQIKNSGGFRYFSNYQLGERITTYDTWQKRENAEYDLASQRSLYCQDLINRILSPVYHQEISPIIIGHLDTLSAATRAKYLDVKFESLNDHLPEIKALLNMIVVQRRNMIFRVKGDFPRMKEFARTLILDLKSEYDLK